MGSPALVITGKSRRVRCKLCLDSRVVEVDTWDDRVEPTFEHDCRGRGPRLSHPVTRDGQPVPFFPVGKRLLVQRLPDEVKVGSLFIPETSQQLQQYATLVAAGPQAQGILDDMGISIGDTISFGKYTGVAYEWHVTIDERIETRRVDQLMVDDVYGGKELAEKMIDGRLGIALYRPEAGGDGEYRFMEQTGMKETTNGNG